MATPTFLSNRIDRAETVQASFRVTGLKPELWDPATGLTHAASFRIEGARTHVTVPFDRFGSVFVVFRATASEPSHIEPAVALHTVAELSGPWQVAFQSDRGAPPTATFPQLADFRDNPDPGIRYFSGIATYAKDVQLSTQAIGGGKIWLDLGQVDDLAEVWVNGKLGRHSVEAPLQGGHHKPHTTGLEPHRNQGRQSLGQPPHRRRTTGRHEEDHIYAADGKIAPGIPRPRSASMPYKPDAPLRPSGLIGPVTIVEETRP